MKEIGDIGELNIMDNKLKLNELNDYLKDITDRREIPAISICIAMGGNMLFNSSYGEIYELGKTISNDTMFDIASLTKIFSTICFMQLIEENKIKLNDPIHELFPFYNNKKIPIEKNGEIIDYCDGTKITWYHVLTHTTGMGWTRKKTRPSLPTIDKGLDAIYDLPFQYQTGTNVIYSDLPIILMGEAMKTIENKTIDEIVNKRIIESLNLKHTKYYNVNKKNDDIENIAPTEYDDQYRNKRVWGYVHDENTYLMGGIGAQAGIFSTSSDVCTLMVEFSNCLKNDGILRKQTAESMIKPLVTDGIDIRGLLWVLNNKNIDTYVSQLSEKAYGHTGFTGCFAWNDPQYNLSIVVLSNDVYNGRDNRKLMLYKKDIIKLIIEFLKG